MKPSRMIFNGQVSGTKQSKDHVTVLLTCNATGSEKLAPLFIHKYENPRAIKNINKKPFQLIIIGTRKVGCKFRSGMSTSKNSIQE